MIKRMTFLRKRADIDRAGFREHWIDPHGTIAARFAGLVCYNQNHLLQTLDGTAPDRDGHFVDGIVELWFDDTAGPRPGTDADVTPLLIADEPTFLDGLTGWELPAHTVPDPSAFKIWILSHVVDEEASEGAITALLHSLEGEVPGVTAVETNVRTAQSRIFTRKGLAVDDDLPNVAICVSFGQTHPSASARDRILTLLATAEDQGFGHTVATLTEEVRIVAPAVVGIV